MGLTLNPEEEDRRTRAALNRFGNIVGGAGFFLMMANITWSLTASTDLMTRTPPGLYWSCVTAGGVCGLLPGIPLTFVASNGITGVINGIIVSMIATMGLGALSGGLAPRLYNTYIFSSNHSAWQPAQYRPLEEGVFSARGGPAVHVNPYNTGKAGLLIDDGDAYRLEAAYLNGTLADFCTMVLEQHAGNVIRTKWPKQRAGRYAKIFRCSSRQRSASTR